MKNLYQCIIHDAVLSFGTTYFSLGKHIMSCPKISKWYQTPDPPPLPNTHTRSLARTHTLAKLFCCSKISEMYRSLKIKKETSSNWRRWLNVADHLKAILLDRKNEVHLCSKLYIFPEIHGIIVGLTKEWTFHTGI